jgi:hypothetical protein
MQSPNAIIDPKATRSLFARIPETDEKEKHETETENARGEAEEDIRRSNNRF